MDAFLDYIVLIEVSLVKDADFMQVPDELVKENPVFLTVCHHVVEERTHIMEALDRLNVSPLRHEVVDVLQFAVE